MDHREALLARVARQRAKARRPRNAGLSWHRHRWSIAAVEEDAFGSVFMRLCACGAVHYGSAEVRLEPAS